MMNVLGFIKPGVWELILVFLIVLLLFGAKRLPEIGAAIGQAIKGFKKSFKDDENDKKDN